MFKQLRPKLVFSVFRKNFRKKVGFSVAILLFALGGCSTYHQQQVRDKTGKNLTVGVVQREIKKGMSSGEVIEILGSPNIVSSDEDGQEVWVYDKVSSYVTYSASAGSLLFFGGGSGAESKSQRTLTVIIKFNKDTRVRDLSYHTSQF